MKRAVIAALLALLMLECYGTPANATPSASGLVRHSSSVTRARILEAAVPTAITVHAGDTYGAWALRYCGTFTAWPALQAVNGWPERRIPIGATARIACTTTAPTTPAAPARIAAAGLWVHPLASGRLGTSCYGWRASTNSFHGGVDMPQPKGTAIRAASAGVVYLKRYQAGGAGYYLVLRHPGNTFTLYAHMIAASPLGIGNAVTAGQQIGRVGATGNATGPHLHFEVQLGGYGNTHRTNPAVFMRNHGVNIGC